MKVMEGLKMALGELNASIKLWCKYQTQALTTTHSWLKKLEIISKLTFVLKMGQFLGNGQWFKAHQILLMKSLHTLTKLTRQCLQGYKTSMNVFYNKIISDDD